MCLSRATGSIGRQRDALSTVTSTGDRSDDSRQLKEQGICAIRKRVRQLLYRMARVERDIEECERLKEEIPCVLTLSAERKRRS